MPGSCIVVCVDGSDHANNAFNFCMSNIYKEGDVILVLQVPEYDVSLSALGSNWEKVCDQVKAEEEKIGKISSTYMDQLREKKMTGKSLTPKKGGKAGEVICETAKLEGATHIVMGTRGLGKLQRAFLGSVSNYVLNHSEIPVTIVPNAKQ